MYFSKQEGCIKNYNQVKTAIIRADVIGDDYVLIIAFLFKSKC